MKTTFSLFLIFLFCISLYAQKKEGITTGNASYYAKRFHNKKTASGIPYKQDAYTCAHRDYPFGTLLLVRNPNNNKTVVVEVTDRGPHKKSRLIDLSYIAAKDLGILNHGITKVEVSKYTKSDSTIIPIDSIIPIAIDSIALEKAIAN